MNYPIPKKMNCPITQPQKQNKYKNEKIEIDNIKFDSKKEAKRYLELKQLERAGVIYNLKLQVPFELQPSFKIGNKTIRAIIYVADFEYYTTDEFALYNHIIEDTKGFRTEVYKLKKKLFAYKYGFEISEV
jgi:hypothetical protein